MRFNLKKKRNYCTYLFPKVIHNYAWINFNSVSHCFLSPPLSLTPPSPSLSVSVSVSLCLTLSVLHAFITPTVVNHLFSSPLTLYFSLCFTAKTANTNTTCKAWASLTHKKKRDQLKLVQLWILSIMSRFGDLDHSLHYNNHIII